MKKSFIFLAVIIAIYFIWNAIQTKPDVSVPNAEVSNEVSSGYENFADTKDGEFLNITVSFKGFGPGKEHTGSFSEVDSKISLVDGVLSGSLSIDMNTLTTDTEALTKHLKTDDFFDVEKFPIAFFSLDSAKDGVVSGTMTIKGVSKVVSFPYTESDSAYTATFNLNMKEFGIDQAFANETIELTVSILK